MTKAQAIAEMQAGRIVTHRHFDKGEWMSMIKDTIQLEDGVRCTPEEFWKWRTDPSWNDGYSIVTLTTQS